MCWQSSLSIFSTASHAAARAPPTLPPIQLPTCAPAKTLSQMLSCLAASTAQPFSLKGTHASFLAELSQRQEALGQTNKDTWLQAQISPAAPCLPDCPSQLLHVRKAQASTHMTWTGSTIKLGPPTPSILPHLQHMQEAMAAKVEMQRQLAANTNPPCFPNVPNIPNAP